MNLVFILGFVLCIYFLYIFCFSIIYYTNNVIVQSVIGVMLSLIIMMISIYRLAGN